MHSIACQDRETGPSFQIKLYRGGMVLWRLAVGGRFVCVLSHVGQCVRQPRGATAATRWCTEEAQHRDEIAALEVSPHDQAGLGAVPRRCSTSPSRRMLWSAPPEGGWCSLTRRTNHHFRRD